MSTAKQEVRLLLDGIPDDATFEDIQYHIYVREKIERGLKDVEEGRVVSEEEMDRKMQKWLGAESGPRPRHSISKKRLATSREIRGTTRQPSCAKYARQPDRPAFLRSAACSSGTRAARYPRTPGAKLSPRLQRCSKANLRSRVNPRRARLQQRHGVNTIQDSPAAPKEPAV